MIIALISMAHTPLLHNKQIPVNVRERLYVLSCSKFLFHRQIILQNGFIKLTCNFANYPTDSKLLLLYMQCSPSQPINYRFQKITLCLDYMHQKKSQNSRWAKRFKYFPCPCIMTSRMMNFRLSNVKIFFVFKVGTCQKYANTCNISILTVL